jgi:hypothetical protein
MMSSTGLITGSAGTGLITGSAGTGLITGSAGTGLITGSATSAGVPYLLALACRRWAVTSPLPYCSRRSPRPQEQAARWERWPR